METRLFSTEIVGKDVETIAGRPVGTVQDIVVNTDDGSIKYILISAGGTVTSGPHKVDENGRIVVETDRIRISGNKLIIN